MSKHTQLHNLSFCNTVSFDGQQQNAIKLRMNIQIQSENRSSIDLVLKYIYGEILQMLTAKQVLTAVQCSSELIDQITADQIIEQCKQHYPDVEIRVVGGR